jgi:hypothetical protein
MPCKKYFSARRGHNPKQKRRPTHGMVLLSPPTIYCSRSKQKEKKKFIPKNIGGAWRTWLEKTVVLEAGWSIVYDDVVGRTTSLFRQGLLTFVSSYLDF